MEEGKLVKPNVLNKPVQDASDLIRSKQKKQESRARGEYELRTIMKKITTIAETRGSHWLFLSLASSLYLTEVPDLQGASRSTVAWERRCISGWKKRQRNRNTSASLQRDISGFSAFESQEGDDELRIEFVRGQKI